MNDQLKNITTAVFIGISPTVEVAGTISGTGGEVYNEDHFIYYMGANCSAESEFQESNSENILAYLLKHEVDERIDFKHFKVVQEFAEGQVELDEDFSDALTSLAKRVGTKPFTRSRF